MSEIKTNKLSSLTGTNNDITIDPDGTGDTIIASGNLGIGTTSPASNLAVVYQGNTSISGPTTGTWAARVVNQQDDPGYNGLSVQNRWGSTNSYILEAAQGWNGAANGYYPVFTIDGLGQAIFKPLGTEAVRISSNGFITHTRPSGAAQSMIGFKNGANFVGEIRTSTTATAYITSSDYRLKENVADITGATDRLKQLNPVRFNFIADADTTVDGFLAHEVQSVVPEAVTGTHNEVDDDGNAVMQGIDQSKLVPLLVATIREQQTAIEALTARVTALEAE